MKFRAREDIKHGHKLFDQGNTYDSVKHGLSDADVEYFHSLGWVSVDGKDDVKRDPSTAVLTPGKINIDTKPLKV